MFEKDKILRETSIKKTSTYYFNLKGVVLKIEFKNFEF